MRPTILITALTATVLCSAMTFARPNPPADRPGEQAAPMRERQQQDRFRGETGPIDRAAPDDRPEMGRRERGFQAPTTPGPGGRGPEGMGAQRQRQAPRDFDNQRMRGGRQQAMREGVGPRQRMMLHQLHKQRKGQFRSGDGFSGRGGFAGPQRRGGQGVGRGPGARGGDRFRGGRQFNGPGQFGERGITGRRPPMPEGRRGFRGDFEQRGRGMSPQRGYRGMLDQGRPHVGARPRDFQRRQAPGPRSGSRFQN